MDLRLVLVTKSVLGRKKLYSFPVAVVKNYHKLDSINNTFILSVLEARTSKSVPLD